ncbi:MAG: DUF5906 domain-containing protein [Phycisphaerales bacterium]
MSDAANETTPELAGDAGQKANTESSSTLAISTSPVPNYDKSIEFLRRWAPEGPWVLTAVLVERKGIEGRTFQAGEETQVQAWLELLGNTHNFYFHVNLTQGEVKTKASRDQIRSMDWLHVDIDPRAGEDLNEERERALRLLREPPGDIPPATVVVFSGGGYQGFWKLAEPVPINGEETAYEDAKRFNQQLEIEFGADNCHNVDRIMRLPGTLNRPDKKKREKGRTLALAELVEWHDDRVYELSKFRQAVENQRGLESGFKPKLTNVNTGNVEPFPNGVDDPRLAQVHDFCKVVIVQGCDPEDPGRFAKKGTLDELDRSDAVFYVACELVRSGCDDDTIYAVLTDPGFRISESVLEAGSRSERYALRQIERAHDAVDDDEIARINRDYFALLEGKSVTFYREEGVGKLTPMDKGAFTFELGHRQLQVDDGKGNTKLVSAVQQWLKHSRRRYYPAGFVLDPTNSHSAEQYNLWQGFSVEPVRGDWSLIRQHIDEVLAGGNAEYTDYILRWAAWSVQNPAKPARVALVFRGKEGVGKGFFGNLLVRLFGEHGLRLQSMGQLAGKFNSHLRHTCLLFADEAVLPDSDQEGSLKGLITEPTIAIEAKGKDIVQSDNHLHVVIASNNSFVVPAGPGSRRFAMFDVPDIRKGDERYFRDLFGQAERGGLAAMLHDLLAWDLGRWHPEAARPDTDALRDQQAQNLPPEHRAFFDCLCSGDLPVGGRTGDGGVFVPTADFLEMVRGQTRRDDVTGNRVAKMLGDLLGFRKDRRSGTRGYDVPPLPEAREAWGAAMFTWGWDESEEWGTPT